MRSSNRIIRDTAEPDGSENVELGVVEREVNEDSTRASVDPLLAAQLLNDAQTIVAIGAENLCEAATVVILNHTRVVRPVEVTLRPVDPTKTRSGL